MSATNGKNDLILTDANSGCACCAPSHGVGDAEPAVSGTESEDFLVAGMTCSHCVRSVTEELSALDGVEAVNVDLNAGGVSRVTVASSSTLRRDDVRAAVTEAGYDLVPAE
ncbi:heavy-metal-associated domain-containing protein [Lysobacter korlensis]|uniref:Heavy-metal-associated domain-containing protein n=1 Tax=Lysobacter korlensis TaxID=553636 RepID=A0ABV6RV36_9GAMM